MEKHPHEQIDTVFNCVIPYIHNGDDCNSISLVCRKWYELDCMTRKHVTVHAFYSSKPSLVAQRFPYLESLTLKGLPSGFRETRYIDIQPWIYEITVSFKFLKALNIRRMHVRNSDLELLAERRGKDLRVLKINECRGFDADGLIHIGRHCNDLRTLCLEHKYNKEKDWRWLHDLALNNMRIESFSFNTTTSEYGVEDHTLLSKNCSQSLVSLKMGTCYLSDLRDVFSYAVNLEEFTCNDLKCENEEKFLGFKFPPKMRCMGINNINRTLLPFVLPFANQLRELYLRCPFNKDSQFYLIQRCPNLEVLYINSIFKDTEYQVIGQVCKKLRKLKTYGFDHMWFMGMYADSASCVLTHRGLIALAQGCLELECLHVELEDYTNEAMKCIGDHLKKLRDVRITLVNNTSKARLMVDSGIKAMLIGCRKLEKLRILTYKQLTDVGLKYIGKYGHNLRYLYLGGYIDVSDAGLVDLSKGCPKLRKLVIKDCPFSERALCTFVLNIQSLRYMWVLDTDIFKSTLLAETRDSSAMQLMLEDLPLIQ